MLEHASATPDAPRRVVVLGAGGFVGGACARHLAARGVPVLALGRPALDLLAADAAKLLTAQLAADDTLLVVSALAPCRNAAMLSANLRMMEPVAAALGKVEVAHVVYISSDAVYRDAKTPLDETSCAEPGSLHGAMHLARELVLKDAYKGPLAILRPSLLYGAGDPHNGYGPNRFRRQAAAGEEILLFGEGEERRDHVLIDDVAELTARVIAARSRGVLNLATGAVHSFREIAERIAAMTTPPARIGTLPRQGPMPHGGYRPFDIAACRKVFPDFNYTALWDGLAKVAREERQHPSRAR
ncbi:MAG TPA: NAD-dependent epimerase/dehydratase family protein [Alphaproteobacteria bacterium]|nr:NAD-dependent epimerase/dehydratase family protein [Alphaproteobacteria bacterium]